MAVSASPSANSLTRPTKEARPPTRWLPRLSAASSAPASKGSRCTRTAMSASGDWREQRDLVAWCDRVARLGVLLVDRDADRPGILESLRETGPAARQPGEQLADRRHALRQGDLLLGGAD